MDLILPFSVKTPKKQINFHQPILLTGSCFAEEIGQKMLDRRFPVHINPHGILFNPASIKIALEDYIEKKVYREKDVFFTNELWQSFNHHGRFSNVNLNECLKNINQEIELAHLHLQKAEWLIVTFGSAYVYKHKKTDQLVGNCHKIPSTEFEKVLLSKEEIVESWEILLAKLQKLNPTLNILLTVSPVRYIRDGLVENNRSKAILLDAVHSLTEQHANCFYFPAYEIVIDELRDYRFFKEDLVHPNQMAINYVWEKFATSFCDKETQEFLIEYEPILNSLHHSALHENTEAHKKFKAQLDAKIKNIEAKYLQI